MPPSNDRHDLAISYETEGLARPRNAVVLYVYGEPDGKRIKIGRTEDIEKRMGQHSKRGPDKVELTLFAAWWGLPNDEQYLLQHFSPLVSDNAEWFLANASMKAWIRELRKKPFVCRSRHPSNRKLDQLPHVHPNHWRPTSNGCERQVCLPLEIPSGNRLWGDVLQELDEEDEGDFYSPKELVERARRVFSGIIDLDPASCREADKVIQATKYYSRHEDGLRQPWFGRVWLNPPFSQWEMWASKLLIELPYIAQAIVVCSTRATTANTFHPIVRACSAMLKIRGRPKFWGPRAGSPDEGHELYYFGDVAPFSREFSDIGRVFVPWRFIEK